MNDVEFEVFVVLGRLLEVGFFYYIRRRLFDRSRLVSFFEVLSLGYLVIGSCSFWRWEAEGDLLGCFFIYLFIEFCLRFRVGFLLILDVRFDFETGREGRKERRSWFRV